MVTFQANNYINTNVNFLILVFMKKKKKILTSYEEGLDSALHHGLDALRSHGTCIGHHIRIEY